MTGKHRLDYYLIALIGLLIAVITFKLNHLDTPYFWDEAWVYAPAIMKMTETGLGLLPTTLPPELSRGHPLVFHFMAACWVKIFGSGFIAVHSFALFISLCLLLAVYRTGSYLVSPLIGFLSALLLAAQPLFLAQSSMILPEVMLGLWTVLAFHSYLKGSMISFVFFSVLMLLTKESGIVFLIALFCWELTNALFLKKEKFIVSQSLRVLFLPFIPLAIASLFFIIQKIQLGWFFYPMHVNLISLSPDTIFSRINSVYRFVFEQQGRFILIFCSCLACIYFWNRFNRIEKVIALIFLLAYPVLFFVAQFFGSIFSIIVTIGLLVIVLRHIFIVSNQKYFDIVKSLFIIVLFTAGFFLFASLNTFTPRYLFVIFPFIMLGLVIIINTATSGKKWIVVVMVVISAFFNIRSVGKVEVARDYSMSYLDAITVQKMMTDFMVQNNMHNKKIFGNWLSYICLIQPDAGYISKENAFTNTSDIISEDMEYCIFSNIEMNLNYDSLIMYMNLEHIASFDENLTWIDVYKFNGFDPDTLSLSKQDLLIRRDRRSRYKKI